MGYVQPLNSPGYDLVVGDDNSKEPRGGWRPGTQFYSTISERGNIFSHSLGGSPTVGPNLLPDPNKGIIETEKDLEEALSPFLNAEEDVLNKDKEAQEAVAFNKIVGQLTNING